MDLERVDTQKAYQEIKRQIIDMTLPPGAAIHQQTLAATLDLPLVAIQEALKLLAHDGLVVLSARHGFYVSAVSVDDLEQLSVVRAALEGLCARLAAASATPDDAAVLQALRAAQAGSVQADPRQLFELDHKFHQAIARAAHNKYLAQTLDHFFGLSQRLWYLALPRIEFLPAAVAEHVALVDAILAGDGDAADHIMRNHVQTFYDRVREILDDGDPESSS